MLVAVAAMESPVRNVTLVARVTMSRVSGNPILPSTQPNRRYMMTPRIVRMLGVKTPLKVPKPAGCVAVELFLSPSDAMGPPESEDSLAAQHHGSKSSVSARLSDTSSSQARATCRSVVLTLPIARRNV